MRQPNPARSNLHRAHAHRPHAHRPQSHRAQVRRTERSGLRNRGCLRACGGTGGAAAWIVSVSGGSAAAWLVAVSSGPPDRLLATLTDSRLPTGVACCGEPALPPHFKSPRTSSSKAPVWRTPLCSDSRVVWHAHLGLHPLRNLAGFTGFVRNNNTWAPSKTVHVFARSCLLMSPCGEAADVATPSPVGRWDVAFLKESSSQLARAIRRVLTEGADSGRGRRVPQRGLFAVGAPCGACWWRMGTQGRDHRIRSGTDSR